MVPVTSLVLEKHVVSSLYSINTKTHKRPTLNTINDVNRSLFIIVHFCIPCSSLRQYGKAPKYAMTSILIAHYQVDVRLPITHNRIE